MRKWGWVLLGTLLSGCGTGEYNDRMAATMTRLNTAPVSRVSLQNLYGYMEAGQGLAGGKVNLRLPQAFKDVFNEGSKDPQTGIALDPQKLFPGGVKLPGYDRTYEAWTKDEAETQWPYYLYLAAQPVDGTSLDEAAVMLQTQLKEKLPTTPDAWETVELTTPEGGKQTWKKIRIADEMFFDKEGKDGNAEYVKQPGVIELYLFVGAGHQVTIGSRVPASLEDPTLVAELVPLTASTLQIDGKSP